MHRQLMQESNEAARTQSQSCAWKTVIASYYCYSLCCCYYHSKNNGGRTNVSSKTSLSSREKHPYAREAPKLTAEHEQIVQCQNATALQSDRCTVIQGHRGRDKLHNSFIQQTFTRCPPGPGPVPDIGAATTKQSSPLPPGDSHPAEQIKLEQIIIEVQSC